MALSLHLWGQGASPPPPARVVPSSLSCPISPGGAKDGPGGAVSGASFQKVAAQMG